MQILPRIVQFSLPQRVGAQRCPPLAMEAVVCPPGPAEGGPDGRLRLFLGRRYVATSIPHFVSFEVRTIDTL